MSDVSCGSCGKPVDDDLGDRKPCPDCGSLTRTIAATIRITTRTSATLVASVVTKKMRSIAPVIDLLVQSVVVAGDKATEGTLIEAVAVPWFDIVDFLAKDPSFAFQIDPRKWEEIVAGAYSKAGFDEVTLTPRSGDHGRDIITVKRGLGTVRVIDQVKAYKPPHTVTADDVRALVGVVHGDGASKGFLTTTSTFAPRLREDPLMRPFIPSRIELVDGPMLLSRLDEIARKSRPQ